LPLGRGSKKRIRHAVDGFLADERIDAGIEVEGEEFARVAGFRIHR
jgi:hypothetical protein